MIVAGQSKWAVEGADQTEAKRALAEAMMWMRPGSLRALVDALNNLYIVSGRRTEEPDNQAVRILATARELEAYPHDLALAAIKTYRGIFFPSAEELRLSIEAMPAFRERSEKIKALRHFVEHGPEPEAREIPSAERARVSEGFRKLKSELAGA